jgi:hypothetical protein
MGNEKAKYGGNQIVQSLVHSLVHDKRMWNGSHFTTDFTDSSTLEFYLKPPSTKEAHAVFSIQVSGATKMALMEAVTTTANGTTLTAYNMHRESTASCTTLFTLNPTWSTNSEKTISSGYIPGSNLGTLKTGGQARSETEWVLAPGVKYIFQATNQSGSTITANLGVEFYEVEE